MSKISGGVPGGWHGGQIPGASSPFRFQFDGQGKAEVENDVAEYLTSIPGPFSILESEQEQEDSEDDVKDGISDENQEITKDEKKAAPRHPASRKKSLDE